MAGLGDDLNDLVTLTGLAFDRTAAPLAALSRREAELRAALQALSGQGRHAGATPGAAAITPAQRAGADMAWNAWAAGQRAALNIALARVLADKAALRKQASTAFGRREAARALAERAARDVRRTRW
jgi:hypothetical protein